MMNEYELQVYIDSHLPEIEHHYCSKTGSHLYENIEDLAGFLKKKFADKDWSAVKEIFNTAETLYHRGNLAVKYGIENVFIYSISSIMPAEKEKRQQLQAIIPIRLFSVYVQQIMHSNN